MLKSLNVTSGRHTTSVHQQRSPSLGHTVASPVDAINDAAQVSPQPTAEPAANGHGAAADPRTAEDRGTGESQGVATATAEDDGAAVRVATKRLRLHMDTEGAADTTLRRRNSHDSHCMRRPRQAAAILAASFASVQSNFANNVGNCLYFSSLCLVLVLMLMCCAVQMATT